jgi:predicted site-specific integrase-resolvase
LRHARPSFPGVIVLQNQSQIVIVATIFATKGTMKDKPMIGYARVSTDDQI